MQFQCKERTPPLFFNGKHQRNFLDGKGPACVLLFIARAFACNFLLYIQIKIKISVVRARKITFINFWFTVYFPFLLALVVHVSAGVEHRKGIFSI